MDLLSPMPFWPVADGLPATFPALEGDASCDVAIIGAGVSGALAAWHLAEAGLDVLVVDRREAAHGSTAGSTSLLQYEIDVPLCELARHLGWERAKYCYHRSVDAVLAVGRLVRRLRLDCGFEPKQSLLLASRSSHVRRLRREFEARREARLRVDWWPRGRLARESTLPHQAAILSTVGAQVDAYRLTYGLLCRARERGARIYDRTAVARARFHPRGVELRAASGAAIRARHLVIACGYESDRLLPDRLTRLYATFVAVSEPVERWSGWPAGRCLIWETAFPYHYLRTTGDGRILIGGEDEPFRTAAHRDRQVAAKARSLERRFRNWFPRIAFEPAGAWAGTFAQTEDGLPLIGRHPHLAHTWFALGYGGNGITYSLIAAELIRDQILGRENGDGEAFGFYRSKLLARRARSQLRLLA